MASFVEFQLDDGSTILVEAAEQDAYQAGLVKSALGDRVRETVVEAKISFDQAMNAVQHSAATLIEKVRSLSDPPDEVEITFGLKLSGDVGNFAIAKVGAESNYTVTLTWKRKSE